MTSRSWLRLLRNLLLLGFALALLFSLWLGYRTLLLPDVAILKDRNATLTLTVRDWQGREHPFLLGPKNPNWTPLATLPEAMKWAVIVAEDANFYEHRGIDLVAVKEALKYDLQQKRLARGASTITQQLAKNIFLSRDKSLLRKVEELILAKRLEAELSKGRILELYLNLVELGPLVYGVGEGARFHFHKPASALTPAQCAFLAAILPGPRRAYNPALKPVKVRLRAARVLRLLAGRGILAEPDYREALAELEGRKAPLPARELPVWSLEEIWPEEGTVPEEEVPPAPPTGSLPEEPGERNTGEGVLPAPVVHSAPGPGE